MSDPVDLVLDALAERGARIKTCGNGWIANCPAHHDMHPSLSIGRGDDGRALLFCHTGCDLDDILAALRLNVRDLFVRRSSSGRAPEEFPIRPSIRDIRGVDPEKMTSLTLDFHCALSRADLLYLADELGVSSGSLNQLVIGFHEGLQAFVFPERDAKEQVVGFGLRFLDGSKGFVKGGRRGLIIPVSFDDFDDPILVVEGPSDVAAALTMSMPAVGRPSAAGGLKHLQQLLKGREVRILAERDKAGLAGAKKLQGQLEQAWNRGVRLVAVQTGDMGDTMNRGHG